MGHAINFFRTVVVTLALMASAGWAQNAFAQHADGAVQQRADGALAAWDAAGSEWVSLDTFWMRYVERHGGLTWGVRDTYPPYGVVKELDTLWIEMESGPCLMQFFHTRWRRANDVRRWDPAFNQYGGCPHVFD